MPFADAGCGVAGALQHLGDGDLIRVQTVGRNGAQYVPVLGCPVESYTAWIAAGH